MTCNQTAIAVLQELCVKRKWNPPLYEVTYSGGSPNDPIFEITVKLCNGVTAKGSGRQKKAAKHDAAKRALEELLNLPAITDGQGDLSEISGGPVNPHDDLSGFNAVGTLTEMCISKHLPIPIFTLIGDEGEPHEKTFTFQCSVSRFSETGVAKKKRQAKHLAALKMIQTLKDNFKDFISEHIDEPKSPPNKLADEGLTAKDLKAFETYCKIKEEICFNPTLNHGLKLSDYHLAFKDKLENFNDVIKSEAIVNERNPIKRVLLLAETFNINVTKSIAESRDGMYVAFIVLDTVPSAVQSGMHRDRDEAMVLAAKALLEFLIVMAK